jgi:hypothetical protein
MAGNTIAYNGARTDQVGHFFWSDGAAIFDAPGSKLIYNTIMDNTDVDFIFGGCAGCVVQNNFIAHSDNVWSASHAALLIHQWPHSSANNWYPISTSGDYTNADFSNNWIQCGPYQSCGNLGNWIIIELN